MVNGDVLRDFRMLIDAETQVSDRLLLDTVSSAIVEAAARGNLASSGAMIKLAKLAADTVTPSYRAAFVFLGRALAAHGVPITSENAGEVLQIMSSWSDRHLVHLKKIVGDTPPFKSKLGEPGRMMAVIDEAARTELLRLNGEINLVAASHRRNFAEEIDRPNNYIFNGPVGQVFTGPGGFGVTVQHIDAEAMEKIAEALTSVKEAIEATREPATIDKSELIAVVDEAKKELAAPKPNTAKLKALVSYIGFAISNVPKLKQAYDTIKWAVSLIGINLP